LGIKGLVVVVVMAAKRGYNQIYQPVINGRYIKGNKLKWLNEIFITKKTLEVGTTITMPINHYVPCTLMKSTTEDIIDSQLQKEVEAYKH
jgi:hypothetical protein